MRPQPLSRKCAAIVIALTTLSATADSVYLAPEEFIATTFAGKPPTPELLWISAAQRDELQNTLDQELRSLRIRYWQKGARSAWILDEIGKDKPITTGVVINDGDIEQLQVLIFRESRGWEVRHAFFSDQFTGVGARENHQLDRHIDGITGATLSVRALERQARLALFLAKQLPEATAADSK